MDNDICGCCAYEGSILSDHGVKHISCELEMATTEDPNAVARKLLQILLARDMCTPLPAISTSSLDKNVKSLPLVCLCSC